MEKISTANVMGIINATDDSFYSSSRTNSVDLALLRAEKMVNEGVNILDIGGCSTRPGCNVVDQETEMKNVIPVIKAIAKRFSGIEISVDTFRSCVAEAAVNAGATIINDISGGDFDDKMFDNVAKLKVPYILTHTRGLPNEMTQNTEYENVTHDVINSLSAKVKVLNSLGVYQIIIDPGFGFAKNSEQNYQMLRELNEFKCFSLPILVGISRKGMIWKSLSTTPADALNGTTVLNTIALLNGADILRVHDVREAVEAVKLVGLLHNH
ncbi:MAG: dihydropteroate synthase [Flavobacteriales bacterium]|nr:dihydropteroate synthase [Flavobacteriales bacterium]